MRISEQSVTQAVQSALPGIGVDVSSTSMGVRVRVKRGEGECRGDRRVMDGNDDIAEALVRAGFHVARRGDGATVHVTAESLTCVPKDHTCQYPTHQGASEPWVAVLPVSPVDVEYACRGCVRRSRAEAGRTR